MRLPAQVDSYSWAVLLSALGGALAICDYADRLLAFVVGQVLVQTHIQQERKRKRSTIRQLGRVDDFGGSPLLQS